MKPHQKLFLALVAGSVLGLVAHPYAASGPVVWVTSQILEPLGQVFLRLVFMVVVPMVFSGLVLGVDQLTRHQGLGRVAGRTLLFTVLASAASVLIGVGLVNLLQPGVGFVVPADLTGASLSKIQANAQAAKPALQALLEIIPRNPVDTAARALDGEMLSLMFFALVFGAALGAVKKSDDSAMMQILEAVYDASMRIVHFAMKLAPFAVFALVFNSGAKFGAGILISLAYYVGVVVAGLLIQQFGVYTLLLKLFTKRKPLEFFRACREVYVYAFATASSNATLPRSLETAEKVLKLPKESSRFVLTVGSTANQNGTALFEGITVLFLAQVYGVHLGLGQQMQVVLMSILAGVGTAGVPGGSLPLIMILLQQVGVPPEGLGIVLGVDRFLDMCRTTVNVSGDLVIAALVGEGRGRR